MKNNKENLIEKNQIKKERLLPIVCELHSLILFPNVERKVVHPS